MLVRAYFVGSVEVGGWGVQVGRGGVGCPNQVCALRGRVFLPLALVLILSGVVDGSSLPLYLPRRILLQRGPLVVLSKSDLTFSE